MIFNNIQMAKQKYYPLKGEAENADNLNKYQAYVKEFQKKLPKDKVPAPQYKKGEVPAIKAKQMARTLMTKTDLKPSVDSTIAKLNAGSSRADSLKAYANASKGMNIAEANRVKASKLNTAANKAMAYAGAYANQEKKRVAAKDATSVARISIPLAETQFHK